MSNTRFPRVVKVREAHARRSILDRGTAEFFVIRLDSMRTLSCDITRSDNVSP